MIHLSIAAIFLATCMISAQQTAPIPYSLAVVLSNEVDRPYILAMTALAAQYVNTLPRLNESISLSLVNVDTQSLPMQTLSTVCDVAFSRPVAGIVGPYYSRDSMLFSAWAQVTNMPLVSYASTAPSLASETSHPTFLRTVPSDASAIRAVLALVKQANARRIGFIAQNDDFGLGAVETCLAIAATSEPRIQVVATSTFDYRTGLGIRTALADMELHAVRYIVLWATAANAQMAMSAAANASMLTGQYAWILSSTIDGSSQIYDGVLAVSAASALDIASSNIPLRNEVLQQAAQQYPTLFSLSSEVPATAFYAFDAILLYANTLASMSALSQATFANTSCLTPIFSKTTATGYLQALRGTTFRGLTGIVSFPTGSNDREAAEVGVLSMDEDLQGRRMKTVGVWSPAGFNPPILPITWSDGSRTPPPDRDMLAGKVLRGVTIAQPPFSYYGDDGKLRGLAIDLVNRLAEQLSFTVNYTVYTPDYTYNRLITSVADGQFDIAVADLTITVSRQRLVDFSMPYYNDAMQLAVRVPRAPEFALFQYLSPFDTGLWVAYLGGAVVCGLLLFWFEKDSNTELHVLGRNQGWKMMSVIVWQTLLAFMTRDAFFPVTAAGRTVFLGVVMTGMIAMSTYTATVATVLTAQALVPSISGIKDLTSGKVNPASIGVTPQSAHSEWYTRFVSPVFTPIFNTQSALLALEAGQLDGVFADGSQLRYIVNQGLCGLEVLPDEAATSDFGFAMQKGWQHVDSINIAILGLRETGYIAELNAKYLGQSVCANSDASATASQMTLVGMGGVFITLLMFVALALCLHLCKSFLISKYAPRRLSLRAPPTDAAFEPVKANRAARASLTGVLAEISRAVMEDIDAVQQAKLRNKRESATMAQARAQRVAQLTEMLDVSKNTEEDASATRSSITVTLNPLRQ